MLIIPSDALPEVDYIQTGGALEFCGTKRALPAGAFQRAVENSRPIRDHQRPNIIVAITRIA
jgi:hypothetical protein